MFSSNQVLSISGGHEDELNKALEFALTYTDDYSHGRFKSKKARFLYQTSSAGEYLIRIGYGDDRTWENGWKEYDFDFDVDIIAKIIMGFLVKQDYPPYGAFGDGSLHKGFIIRSAEELWDERSRTISDDILRETDLVISPYWAFYHK